MVMMHDVLEHIHDSPRELMNDLLETGEARGLLFVTVPNQVNIKNRIEVCWAAQTSRHSKRSTGRAFRGADMSAEYVRDDLVKLAAYLDLKVIELHGVDHMLQKIPAAARAPYLAATAVFDGWKDSWLLVARKPAGWSARRTLSPEEQKDVLLN